jgi:hypothetical protein
LNNFKKSESGETLKQNVKSFQSGDEDDKI